MFALDSNAWIHALKGIGRLRDRIEQTAPGDLAIPSVVLYELEFGTLRSRNPTARRRDLDRLISLLVVLPFDRNAALHAAKVRAALEAVRESIGPLDTLIAATALAHGAILVTNNSREFSRVPGLLTDDWF